MYFIMSKIYSSDFRFQAISCLQRGKSYEEVQEFFGVSKRTLQYWLAKFRITGGISNINRGFYKPRKIDNNKLVEAISLNPDNTLKELSEMFNCSAVAIYQRCKKLGITRKKNQSLQGARRGKKTRISSGD
jgi:transposase